MAAKDVMNINKRNSLKFLAKEPPEADTDGKKKEFGDTKNVSQTRDHFSPETNEMSEDIKRGEFLPKTMRILTKIKRSIPSFSPSFCFLIFVAAFLEVSASKVEIREHPTGTELFPWTGTNRRHVPPVTIISPTLPPEFESQAVANLSVTASKTAVLSCIVHNLGNRSVSWIRHRDLHILAVGIQAYTNDERFIISKEDNGEYRMRIRYAVVRDSGQYDCQVSTRPPISKTFHLSVIEPRARVLRAPEMHVGAGSLINLTCIISYSPEPPEYLYWYHKERVVRADGTRVFITTHLSSKSTSQLLIKGAQSKDSGTYACSPAHSKEHSVTVHVVTDGYPAAMQGGSSLTIVSHKKLLCLMTVPLLVTVVASNIPYFYM